MPVRRPLLVGKSLSARIAITVAVVMVGILSLFWVWASTQLRSDLFTQRLDVILEDASVRFSQAKGALDQSTATTADQVQDNVSQVLNGIRESAAGAGAVDVLLLRSADASDSARINEYADPEMEGLVSSAFAAQLSSDSGTWQSVEIPGGSGPTPAVLTGTLVDVPLAGPHELLIVYSLATEQATVNRVLHVLMVSGLPISIIVSAVTFILVYRLLRPVRAAADAATELADGDLDSRVKVTGRDEMARLGAAFNDMAESLQQQITDYDKLSRFQQNFVSDVSHELRTPMTTVRIADEVIYEARDALPPAAKRSAELLHLETTRLEQMLADLLEISRYDAQSAQMEGEPTDLYLLVQKVIDANSELAEHLGVKVELAPRPPRTSLPLDSKRVERVVRNLLVNACEYAEGTTVKVTVASAPTSVAVRVRDHGVGMDRATASRVFDRFYRANPSRTRTTGGSGLGLAIAKEDVLLHNGIINVRGEPGKGSSFVVTFPRQPLSAVTEFPLPVWEEEE